LRTLADAHDGVLRLSTGDAPTSFIDTRDIAAVAVEALLGQPAGREYALTGPESLTFAQVASVCQGGAVPIHCYEAVSDAECRKAALALGWRPDYVDVLSGLFATIAAGYAADVTDDVAQATGHQPRSLTEFMQGLG